MSDLSSLTIPQLKSRLTALNVDLPATTQRKQYYISLLQKAVRQHSQANYYRPSTGNNGRGGINEYEIDHGDDHGRYRSQDTQMMVRGISSSGNQFSQDVSVVNSVSGVAETSVASSSSSSRSPGIAGSGSQTMWPRKIITQSLQASQAKVFGNVAEVLHAKGSDKKGRRDSFQGNNGALGRRTSVDRTMSSQNIADHSFDQSFQSMGSTRRNSGEATSSSNSSTLRQRTETARPVITTARAPVIKTATKKNVVTESDLDNLNLRKSILDGLEVYNKKSLIDRLIGSENICGIFLIIITILSAVYIHEVKTVTFCDAGIDPDTLPIEKIFYLFDRPPCHACPEHAICVNGIMKCQYPYIQEKDSCTEDIEVERNALEMISYLETMLARQLGDQECCSDKESVKVSYTMKEIKTLLSVEFAYFSKFQDSLQKLEQKLESEPENYTVRNVSTLTSRKKYISTVALKTLACELREFLEEYLIIFTVLFIFGSYATFKIRSVLHDKREWFTAKNFYSDIKTELKLKVDSSTDHGLSENQIKDKLVSAHGVKVADHVWSKIESLRKKDSHVTKFESLRQGRPVMQWQFNEQGGGRALFS